MVTDPYVQGWLDCAETIATLGDIKAKDVRERGGPLKRAVSGPLAAVYRHAAEMARATTVVNRADGQSP